MDGRRPEPVPEGQSLAGLSLLPGGPKAVRSAGPDNAPSLLQGLTWTVAVLDDGRLVFLRLLLKAKKTHRERTQVRDFCRARRGHGRVSHRAGVREVKPDVGVQVVWLNA